MQKLLRILLLIGLVAPTSCIENDIPYPVEEIEILTYEGVGFRSTIDQLTRTVTLHLDEPTNITAVEVTSVTISENGVPSIPLTGIFNFSSPLEVTLSRYQD